MTSQAALQVSSASPHHPILIIAFRKVKVFQDLTLKQPDSAFCRLTEEEGLVHRPGAFTRAQREPAQVMAADCADGMNPEERRHRYRHEVLVVGGGDIAIPGRSIRPSPVADQEFAPMNRHHQSSKPTPFGSGRKY